MCLDYRFLRHGRNEDLVTTVGKCEPFHARPACASELEGADAYTTSRLNDLIAAQGDELFVYKTDQKSSLEACVSEGTQATQ